MLRYAVGTVVMQRYPGRFPLGTVLINLSGSFAIGLLMSLLTERFHAHPHWRLLLVVGVLGGYTTFSSFEYETLFAVREGRHDLALLNVLGSVVGGYIAVWLGSWAAKL